MASISPLAQFSTCEISDALLKLNVPNAGHLSDINIFSPNSSTRICGPAYTVKMVLATDTAAPKLNQHFVDTAPQGSIIVIDAPSARNAVWGGLMTAGAQSRGALGVVISGRCRDLAEHQANGFPVFARAHSTLGQSPFTRPSQTNIPITISPPGEEKNVLYNVTVLPSDWIVGDGDGVVCVPKDLEFQVIELAAKGKEIDAKCLKDIRAGTSIQLAFATHRGK